MAVAVADRPASPPVLGGGGVPVRRPGATPARSCDESDSAKPPRVLLCGGALALRALRPPQRRSISDAGGARSLGDVHAGLLQRAVATGSATADECSAHVSGVAHGRDYTCVRVQIPDRTSSVAPAA